MHRLTYLAAFHNQRCLHTLAHTNQVVVNGAYSQQRGDSRMLVVDITVGEDDVVHALVHTSLSLFAELVECVTKPFFTFGYLKRHSEFPGVETLVTDVTQYVELCIGKHGLRQAHHLTVRGIGGQNVGTHSTDVLGEAHHQFLANRVNGGVRYLCELLTEIVEQHLRTVTYNGQWCVVTHSGHRFLSCCCHWDNRLVDVFLTETKLHQFVLKVVHAVLYLSPTLQFFQLHTVLIQPLAIRMGLG